MEYNRNQFIKKDDKKILHKVKKQWVVISSALLLATGTGALIDAQNTKVHAQSKSNSVTATKNSNSISKISRKQPLVSSVPSQAQHLHQQIINNSLKTSQYVNDINSNFNSTKEPNVNNIHYNQSTSTNEVLNRKQNVNVNNLKNNEVNSSSSQPKFLKPSTINMSNSSNTPKIVDNKKDIKWSPTSTAKWNFYNNGTLYIHDGAMATNNWPTYFTNNNDANESKINKIIIRNTKAPKDSSQLFGQWDRGSHGNEINHKFGNLHYMDVSGLDTSDVTNMSDMFGSWNDGYDFAGNLTSLIGLNHFNTSNVTNMRSMFAGQNRLSYLDLSSFDTRKIPDIHNPNRPRYDGSSQICTFFPGNETTHIKLGSDTYLNPSTCMDPNQPWFNDKTGKVYNGLPFENGQSMGGNWFNIANSAHGMWNQANWLQDNNGNLFLFNGNNVNGGATLDDNPGKHNITWNAVHNIYTHDVVAPTFSHNLFSGLPNLQNFYGNGLDVSHTVDMDYMFKDDPQLTSLGYLYNWNTSSVASMNGMFESDSSLVNLFGLQNWNVNNVYTGHGNLCSMFKNDYYSDKNDKRGLEDITALANWNTNRNVAMNNMFQNDKLLSIMNVGNNLKFNNNVSGEASGNVNLQGYWENMNGQHIKNAEMNNRPAPGYYYNLNNCSLANFTFVNWRTGRVVNIQSNVPVPENHDIRISNLHPRNGYRLPSDGNNENPFTHSTNYLPHMHIGTTPQSYTVPVVSDDVLDYGYWGTAHYELTDNGTLYLFNGSMKTNHEPSFFSASDGSGQYDGASFLNYPMKNADHVKVIKTSNVIAPSDMGGMFGGDSTIWNFPGGFTNYFNKLQSVDLSGMNTSATWSINGLFHGDADLQHVYFGHNFDTHYVHDMSGVFDDDRNLQSLDLSSFDTNNVNNYNSMFWNMPSLKDLDLYNFNINYNKYGHGLNIGDMFNIKSSGYGGSKDTALKEIVFGPKTYIPNNFASDLSDSAMEIPNNSNHTNAWVNSASGKIVSNLSSLRSDKNPGTWISTNDAVKYHINYIDIFNHDAPVTSKNGYILGLNHASFLPVNNVTLPSDYQIAPNQGLTVPISPNNTNVTVKVFKPQDMQDWGTWGTADYFLYKDGTLGLDDGNLETNYAPNKLRNEASNVNYIKTVGNSSVLAPGDASHIFSGTSTANDSTNPFYGNGFKNVNRFDLGNLNTNTTYNMSDMFSNLPDLQNIDLSSNDFNTNSVYNMKNMFGNDNNLRIARINNFVMNGENGTTDTTNMFANDNNIQGLDIGDNTIFNPNTNLKNGHHWIDIYGNQVDLLNNQRHPHGLYFNSNDSNLQWDSVNYTFKNKVVHRTYILPSNSTYIDKIDIPNIKGYIVKSSDPSKFLVQNHTITVPVDEIGDWGQAQWILDSDGSMTLQHGDLYYGNWHGPQDRSDVKNIQTNDINAPSDINHIFSGLTNLSDLDLSGLNGTSDTSNLSYAFANDPNLSIINGLGHLQTASQKSTMQGMLSNDPKLNHLNLTGLNTVNVSNLSQFLKGNNQLSDIKGLNTINTVNVSDMNNGFASDSNLKRIDLSGFDTRNVKNMYNLFNNDSQLSQIQLGNYTKLVNANIAGRWVNHNNQYVDLNNDINPVADMYHLTDTNSFNVIYMNNDTGNTIQTENVSGKIGSFFDIEPYLDDVPDGTVYAPNGTVNYPQKFVATPMSNVVIPVKYHTGLVKVVYEDEKNNNIINTVIAHGINGHPFNYQKYDSMIPSNYQFDNNSNSGVIYQGRNYPQVIIKMKEIQATVNITYVNDVDQTQIGNSKVMLGQIGTPIKINQLFSNVPNGYQVNNITGLSQLYQKNNQPVTVHIKPDNAQIGAPIVVRYINQHGQEVGSTDVITGHLNQKINVGSRLNIPQGYHLTNNSTLYRHFTNETQDINLNVVGKQITKLFMMYQIERNNNGSVNTRKQVVNISGQVGDIIHINPYQYKNNSLIPNGYHADNQNAELNIKLNDNNLSPINTISYMYHQN